MGAGQIADEKGIYDVIVVGSGATGGVAAKELSDRGLTVLVLEAGRTLDPKTDLANGPQAMAKRLYNLGTGKQSIQARHPGYWKANPDLFVDELDNPYTTPTDKPFTWARGRQVGGKSLTWGGITLRLSDYEFKAASQDSHGHDWPISYDDLAPYYDRLETFFGVHGATDHLPQLPDGLYLPPADLTPAEVHLQAVVDSLEDWPGMTRDRSGTVDPGTNLDHGLDLSTPHMIVSRGFPLHQPTPDQEWPRSSSVGSSLKAALDCDRVTLQSDAVVSHLTFDPETRRATGVTFVHRVHHTRHTVRSRAVMMCASAIESVRILLHSTAAHQPGGLANPSDLLGRYLMDHVSTCRFFVLPGFDPAKGAADLSGRDSFFIPRFCNLGRQDHPFLRGYGLWGGIQRFGVPPVLQRVRGAIGFLIGHGEVLPQHHNRVSLDSTVTDAWGIPAAHIDCEWSDNEQAMAQHMQQTIEYLVQQAGGQCMGLTELFHAPLVKRYVQELESMMAVVAPPGYYIHEVGGACMGTSPQHSVVNAHNQCWDAPNVFVTDGACWPSSGWQSPTLTSMALTARASEFLATQLQQGAASLSA